MFSEDEEIRDWWVLTSNLSDLSFALFILAGLLCLEIELAALQREGGLWATYLAELGFGGDTAESDSARPSGFNSSSDLIGARRGWFLGVCSDL